jgi:catechol 2,3-dioxygenase-like lactoylglutathione lyase family enzyme
MARMNITNSAGFSRRRFLQAAATIVAAHGWGPGTGQLHAMSRRTEAPSPLAQLDLLTAAPIDAMRQFYGTSLGLPVVRLGERLEVHAGGSRLVFRYDPAAAEPFYHFAFNIPENKILLAREWQAARTPLLPIPERLRDARFPPDVVDYRHWNAHSVFFLDPGGNVVEYIARHDLRNARPGAFTPDDILCASEIGLVVDDVPAVARLLSQAVGWTAYRGSSEAFTPLGDEHGLLLVFKRGRILNFQAAGTEKAARVFPTAVTVRAQRTVALRLDGFPYQLRSAP